MKNAYKGHIALLVAQIIYALNYSIAKDLMPDFMGPLSLVMIRIVGAMIMFWVLSLFVKTQKVERRDMYRMMWLAFFGVLVNQVFFIYGLSITTPINSAVIMTSNPIMVFIFTLVMLQERVTLVKISGLILAITGAGIILRFKGDFETGSDTIVGDIMTFINSASWAVFIVMVKPIMQKYNTVTAMRWMFLFGSIYVLPVGLADTINTDFTAFDSMAWFNLSFVVVATTFFAYLLNVYGLEELSANTVSAYIYLQPFLAALFAIMAGEDEMTPTKLFSGILIISGLYLINLKSKRAIL